MCSKRKTLQVGLWLVCALITAGQNLAVGQTAVEQPWSELPPLITDREIALALPDGTYVRGKALVVGVDGLEVDIKKTSDGSLHPKGRTRIPRASVSVIELREMRKFPIGGIGGGVAGYLGGALLGAITGMGIEKITGNDTDFPTGALLGGQVGAIAGAVVGGRLGHNLDRRNILIKIIPDPPETPLDPPPTGSEAMDFDAPILAARDARPDAISGLSVAAGSR